MVIKLKKGTKEFDEMVEFLSTCSWEPGRNLAEHLKEGVVSDGKCYGSAPRGAIVWEKNWVVPFGAFENGKPAGCSVLANNDYPKVPYFPWVGPTFVGEEFRGKRISEQMLSAIEQEAKALGYKIIYLVSEHVGLYEKYGYERFETTVTPWDPNQIDGIFRKKL